MGTSSLALAFLGKERSALSLLTLSRVRVSKKIGESSVMLRWCNFGRSFRVIFYVSFAGKFASRFAGKFAGRFAGRFAV